MRFQRTLGMGCLFPVYIRAIVKGIAVWLLLSEQKMSAPSGGWTGMGYIRLNCRDNSFTRSDK
jgi:hypothetical protein